MTGLMFYVMSSLWDVRSWCNGLSDRSSNVDPWSYLLFQAVPNDWFNVLCDVLSVGCSLMVQWVVRSILHGGPM